MNYQYEGTTYEGLKVEVERLSQEVERLKKECYTLYVLGYEKGDEASVKWEE